MPRYDYKCKNCSKDFFIICQINDSRENIKCDSCGSANTLRIYNATILKNKSEEKNIEILRPKTEHPHLKNSDHDHEYGQHCSPENDYI